MKFGMSHKNAKTEQCANVKHKSGQAYPTDEIKEEIGGASRRAQVLQVRCRVAQRERSDQYREKDLRNVKSAIKSTAHKYNKLARVHMRNVH